MWIQLVVLFLTGHSISGQLVAWQNKDRPLKYGANCTIACHAFPAAVPEQKIYFKGKKIVADDIYNLTTLRPESLELLIRMVNMDTAGEYTCRASGRAPKTTVVKMLIEAVAPISVYHLAVGSRATVNTTVYGYPRPASYTYKKKNATGSYQIVAQYNTKTNLMAVGTGKYEISGYNAHLTITMVAPSDGGDYQVSDGGSNTANFSIEVGYAPKIKIKPALSYDVVSDVATIFSCEFENLANLTVTWIQTLKGGITKSVTKTSNGPLTLDGTNLKIIPVLANKGDSFQCVGENIFGIDKATTVISMVYVKPEIKKFTNKMLLLKSKDSITCEAAGNPEPVATLMKKGKDGKFKILAGQSRKAGKSTYNMTSVAASDAGNYKCTAVITVKPELKDEAMLSAEVISPPIFDSSKSSSILRYLSGKATKKILTCVASGIPAPTIKFMRGKVELAGAVMKQEGHTVTVTVQYMANVTADAGIITCVAENKINKTAHTITIAFIYKPTAVLLQPEGVPVSFFYSDVEFSWVKPASDGGSTNMEYEVKYCPQSNGAYPSALCKSVTAKMTTVTLKGLKDRTMYSFTISAKNEQGHGPPLTFQALTGSALGPSIGALAGVIVADILILSVVIDSYLCHFVDRGFLYYFLGRYYHGKGKKENSKFYQ